MFQGCVRLPQGSRNTWSYLPWSPAGHELLKWMVQVGIAKGNQLGRVNIILRLQLPGSATGTHHDFASYGGVVFQCVLPVDGKRFRGQLINQWRSELVFFRREAWMRVPASAGQKRTPPLKKEFEYLTKDSLKTLQNAADNGNAHVAILQDQPDRIGCFHGEIRGDSWSHGTTKVPEATESFYPVRLSLTIRPNCHFPQP